MTGGWSTWTIRTGTLLDEVQCEIDHEGERTSLPGKALPSGKENEARQEVAAHRKGLSGLTLEKIQ